MTKEEAKELLPIMQAFADGKTIQFRTNNRPWVDLLDNDLNTNPLFEYRIKPEPKYRPFKSQEECWNEMHNHSDFGFIRCKKNKVTYSITALSEHYLMTSQGSFSLSAALEVLEFLDEKPFGVKEE